MMIRTTRLKQASWLSICCLAFFLSVELKQSTTNLVSVAAFSTTTTTSMRRRDQQQTQQRKLWGVVAVKKSYQLQMSSSSESSSLSNVIYADDEDFNFDPGQGGVRLAEESALLLTGTIPGGGGGQGRPKPSELIRYKQLTSITEKDWEGSSVNIVATGTGRELYQDPGNGAEQIIELAPLEAVKDLWNTIQQSDSATTKDALMDDVHVSITGGDDLQVLEVLDALVEFRKAWETTMQSSKSSKKKSSITFSSLSHPSFTDGEVSMALVAISSSSDAEDAEPKQKSGIEKSLAEGKIFVAGNQYWTVVEEDINPDVE